MADLSVAGSPGNSGWTSDLVVTVSYSIVGLLALAMILSAILLFKRESPAEAVLKVFGTYLIVGVPAILLVAGYSDRQMAPVIGLLGAVVGYLLGKDTGAGK